MPQTSTTEETREIVAAKRAMEDLSAFVAGKYSGDSSHALRDVMFNLARAYQFARIQYTAREIMEEGKKLFSEGSDTSQDEIEDWENQRISEDSDRLCIYTADNLAALIGGETVHDDSVWEEMGTEAMAGIDSLSTMAERVARYSVEAELRATLDRMEA